ncbi:hypothetical protein Q428_09475 [Fervidicella metallireducens AeB]|uniref:Uncharacterized protein n=1 Tax=Fervidicella metallireducens AeB TaxID=1403537 RepID=A0A017RUT1_9CLOT|nr:hypothetical protein [Fervidicella metallireducens]EYE88174.1 hypothetical protein Q428_09475 [Fervidicella metallireducens AeB]
MSDILRQKLIKLNISMPSPEKTAHILTTAASDGYCYGGHATQMKVGGGAIYIRNYGVYTDNCLFWLNNASKGSLFHAWQIGYRSIKTSLENELNRLIEHENSIGFNLVALIPIDAFTKDEVGPGTVSYYALFERRAESKSPLMPDRWTLKPERIITDENVSCPVIGCDFDAPRMTADGLNLNSSKDKLSSYLCPRHGIYISPSTFEYEEPTTSLIWPEDKETALRISKSGKRTWSRMGRERDEDSLVWNVFRFLEREKLFNKIFEDNIAEKSTLFSWGSVEKVIYWSVDIEKMAEWEDLKEARSSIGENCSYGSEPDIILVFENMIVIIEAKLDSTSVTPVPSQIPAYYNDKKGIFKRSLEHVAGSDGIGYELMRYFLLGETLREQLNKINLVVVSITQDGLDDDLVKRVNDCIHIGLGIFYYHMTWGQLYSLIEKIDIENKVDTRILLRYLKGKTLGYDEKGKLRTLLP